RHMRKYPQHICMTLDRLTRMALSDEYRHYQKFQLLLCDSEISSQSGDHIGYINHAKNSSKLSVPDGYLFFVHLLLYHPYVADDKRACLDEEYTRYLNME
ncbi:hypothetical protein Tco_1053036, partial [Tanacetum coccineum]